jgi:hypothetical protein
MGISAPVACSARRGGLLACAALAATGSAALPGEPAGKPAAITVAADRTFEKDLVVAAGGRLVIRPGVTLKFAPGAGIVCRGVIEARGTAQKPIAFVAGDPRKGWGNLALLGAGTAGSALVHCRFSGGRGRRTKFGAQGVFERFARDADKKNTLECGGAIFAYRVAKLRIRRCGFRGNKAFWGGAISCWAGATPLIESCRFEENSAYWGGAVHCWGRSGATVRRCYFRGNTGDKANGDAGAVQFMNGSDGRVENCYFTGNSAKWGGAIHVLQQSRPTIAGNYIVGNRAWNNSSAISCFGRASPTITGNYITGNHVAGDKGVAIATVAFSRPVIRGNYIAGNTNDKQQEANLDACPTFKGKPDTSTCEDQQPAAKDEILAALKKAGVLDLAPREKPGDEVRDRDGDGREAGGGGAGKGPARDAG